jgi:hypothetical protein
MAISTIDFFVVDLFLVDWRFQRAGCFSQSVVRGFEPAGWSCLRAGIWDVSKLS